MSKNTLYITFDGLSDPLGQSQILPYLCGIAENGFNITILSCEKKERFEKEKETILSRIEKLPITWNYIFYDENGGTLSRLNYIQKLKTLAKQVHLQEKITLIHCRSYLASLIGLSFKLNYKIPFIFDMRGLWANERIDGGIWRKSNVLHNLFFTYFKKKEKQFLAHSDAIVSLTNNGMKELNKLAPEASVTTKTTVIPCCTNTTLFKKDSQKETISINGVAKNDHLLIYTGSIGTWYYTREMIDCVIAWKKQIPSIKLLILTKDLQALQNILQAYTEEEQKLIVSASASYKDVPDYLAQANAAIFFIKPSYSKIASSPTKMAECWAMDLPIITNSGIGDNDLYFNNYKGGILIPEFSKSEYEKACHNYLQLSAEKNTYRKIALEHFDNQMAIEKYTSIYKSLTQ